VAFKTLGKERRTEEVSYRDGHGHGDFPISAAAPGSAEVATPFLFPAKPNHSISCAAQIGLVFALSASPMYFGFIIILRSATRFYVYTSRLSVLFQVDPSQPFLHDEGATAVKFDA
jgi:hypothetical protein